MDVFWAIAFGITIFAIGCLVLYMSNARPYQYTEEIEEPAGAPVTPAAQHNSASDALPAKKKRVRKTGVFPAAPPLTVTIAGVKIRVDRPAGAVSVVVGIVAALFPVVANAQFHKLVSQHSSRHARRSDPDLNQGTDPAEAKEPSTALLVFTATYPQHWTTTDCANALDGALVGDNVTKMPKPAGVAAVAFQMGSAHALIQCQPKGLLVIAVADPKDSSAVYSARAFAQTLVTNAVVENSTLSISH